jgi:hypothetical protein
LPFRWKDRRCRPAAPIALHHPLIFCFGHTAAFFINKLLLGNDSVR